MRRLFALTTCLLLVAAATAQESAQTSFAYQVRLDPDGRVLTIEPEVDNRTAALPASVDAALQRELQARSYVRADALGGTLTTFLEGEVALQAVGEGLGLSITALRAGPRLRVIDLPHAPTALIRDKAEADLVLHIDVSGTGVATLDEVQGIDTLSRDHAQRVRERLVTALRKWRFKPERHDGRPLPSEFVVRLQYRVERGADTAWDWRGPAIGQVGHVRVPEAEFRPMDLGLSATRR
jgi:hypothetical protein